MVSNVPNPKRIHVVKEGDPWKAIREGAHPASATAPPKRSSRLMRWVNRRGPPRRAAIRP
jgi:hypothetical protein